MIFRKARFDSHEHEKKTARSRQTKERLLEHFVWLAYAGRYLGITFPLSACVHVCL